MGYLPWVVTVWVLLAALFLRPDKAGDADDERNRPLGGWKRLLSGHGTRGSVSGGVRTVSSALWQKFPSCCTQFCDVRVGHTLPSRFRVWRDRKTPIFFSRHPDHLLFPPSAPRDEQGPRRGEGGLVRRRGASQGAFDLELTRRRGLTFLAQWLLGRVPNVSTGPQAWLCDAVHTLQSPLASVAAIRILLETEGCGVREHVWWRPRQLPVLQMQLGSCGHFCIQLQRGVAD